MSRPSYPVKRKLEDGSYIADITTSDGNNNDFSHDDDDDNNGLSRDDDNNGLDDINDLSQDGTNTHQDHHESVEQQDPVLMFLSQSMHQLNEEKSNIVKSLEQLEELKVKFEEQKHAKACVIEWLKLKVEKAKEGSALEASRKASVNCLPEQLHGSKDVAPSVGQRNLPAIQSMDAVGSVDDDKKPKAQERSERATRKTDSGTTKATVTNRQPFPSHSNSQTKVAPSTRVSFGYAASVKRRQTNKGSWSGTEAAAGFFASSEGKGRLHPKTKTEPSTRTGLGASPAHGNQARAGSRPDLEECPRHTKEQRPVAKSTRRKTLPACFKASIPLLTVEQTQHEIIKSGTRQQLGNFFKVQDDEDYTLGDWDIIATVPVNQLDTLLRQLKKVLLSVKNPNFPMNILHLVCTYDQFRLAKYTKNPTDLFRTQVAQFFNVEFPSQMDKFKNEELEKKFAALG